MDTIVSVIMGGGLGNMMFQAAFAVSHSMKNNCCYELINFHKSCYDNKACLGRSGEYDENVFKWFDLTLKQGEIIQHAASPFHYEPHNVISNKRNIFSGYYQSEKYFLNFSDNIRSLYYPSVFKLKQLEDKHFLKFKDFIALHIRRGDYLSQTHAHPVASLQYYLEAIKYFGLKKNYLIFSDDIEWCKIQFAFLENVYFVENEIDYNSLYMMSACENNIISNSSFSWWGAWLNPNPEKTIIYPNVWFGPHYSNLNTNDICPKTWTVLNV